MTITAQSWSGKVSPPPRPGVTSNRGGPEGPARPVDPSQPQPLGPSAPWGWNVTTPTVRNVSNVGGMPLLALGGGQHRNDGGDDEEENDDD